MNEGLSPATRFRDYRQNTSFSPQAEKVVPFSVIRQRSVEKYVRIERDERFEPIMEGIKSVGKVGTMEQLADALSLTRSIAFNDALHNSGER